MSIEQKHCHDIKEIKRFSIENQASQCNVLQDRSNFQKKTEPRRRNVEQSTAQQTEPRRRNVEQSIAQQKKLYWQKLTEVRDKKEEYLSRQKIVPIEKENTQFLKVGKDYIYKKTAKSYIEITTGTHTTEITIQVKTGNETPRKKTIKYSGEASSIARLCSAKLDAYIQNNYHDVLAQAKRKIEEEMAPRYAKLGPMPYTADMAAARAKLDSEREEKINEAKEKAGADLRNFLDKYGGKHMNSELLEELHWVEGTDAASREQKEKALYAENKLKSNSKELARITVEINDKIKEIQEIKQLILSSLDTSSQTYTTDISNQTSPSDVTKPQRDPLALENVDQKIIDYIKGPAQGLSDPIYKDINNLSTFLDNDKAKYPGLDEGKIQQLRQALREAGQKLLERQIKLDEQTEMQEQWLRYTASHYGARLKLERELVDHHLVDVAKAAGEHARAVYQENELNREVERFYKIAGKGFLPPTSLDPHFAELNAQFTSTMEQLSTTMTQTEQGQHSEKLFDLSKKLVDLDKQIQKTLDPKSSLQTSLEKQTTARFNTLAKVQEQEQVKALTDRLKERIKQAKERDDANDALDLAKVKAIKETDKISLQHLHNLELERVKHFYHERDEEHKVLNKEEEEIRQLLIHLEKIDVGNQIQQKRMNQMYWLASFGSGDQAALFSMGRESTAEFSSFMSLFR
jgi:hypothetical protein